MAEEQIFFESAGVEAGRPSEPMFGRCRGGHLPPTPAVWRESMHNNVVKSLVKAYKKANFTTLRFNFRGVGRSAGLYDEGTGEQVDVQGAVAYLEGLGLTGIQLAGYSFGAWVNALAINKMHTVASMIMVSPPVNFIDFSFLNYTPQLQLIITGAQDDIASPDMIQEMLPGWNENAAFRIIQGADHFYGRKTGEIESIVEAFLNQS